MRSFYKTFYLILALLLGSIRSYGSDTLRGIIENESGSPVRGAKVLLNNRFSGISTGKGEFTIVYTGALLSPIDIALEHPSYQIKEYVYLEEEGFVEIAANPVTKKEIAKGKTGPVLDTNLIGRHHEPVVLAPPMMEIDSEPFHLYKEELQDLVEDLKQERKRIEESNRLIHEEIVRISEKLVNDKNLTPEQRKELETYVVTLEKTVQENNEAFAKAQEHTQSLIVKLKSVIAQKDAEIFQIEKEKQLVEKKLNRNVIIFSIISFSLLFLAMVFYTIAYKMKKQKASRKKLEAMIDTLSQDIQVPLMNLEKLSGDAIQKQKQNASPYEELSHIKETVGNLNMKLSEFIEESNVNGWLHKQNPN